MIRVIALPLIAFLIGLIAFLGLGQTRERLATDDISPVFSEIHLLSSMAAAQTALGTSELFVLQPISDTKSIEAGFRNAEASIKEFETSRDLYDKTAKSSESEKIWKDLLTAWEKRLKDHEGLRVMTTGYVEEPSDFSLKKLTLQVSQIQSASNQNILLSLLKLSSIRASVGQAATESTIATVSSKRWTVAWTTLLGTLFTLGIGISLRKRP